MPAVNLTHDMTTQKIEKIFTRPCGFDIEQHSRQQIAPQIAPQIVVL
jgi:hypothetical protein